jgi:hypothetical protein
MPIPEPLSALTLYSTYHTADEVMILDTVDTTMASTGTNKRIQFSTLLSMSGAAPLISPTFTGTVTLPAASNMPGPVFNVRAYGAIGDGSTDDTIAIQAAITAAAAVSGIVYFPVGIYKFSTLAITGLITLQGSGWNVNLNVLGAFSLPAYGTSTNFGGTILRSTATSGKAISFSPAAPGEICLRDLAVVGPGSGSSVGLAIGTSSLSVVGGVISNVWVGNFATGVVLANVEDYAITGLRIRGCTTGISLLTNSNNDVFVNLDVEYCVTGLVMDSSSLGNTVYSGVFQENTGAACTLNGSCNALYNCYFENPSCTYAVSVVGGTSNAIRDSILSWPADNINIGSNAVCTLVDNYLATSGATVSDAGVDTMVSYSNAIKPYSVAATASITAPILTANSYITVNSGTANAITINRIGSGSTNGSYWGFQIQNASAGDDLVLAQSGSAFATGGIFSWVGNSQPFMYVPGGSAFVIGTGTGNTGAIANFSSSGVSIPNGSLTVGGATIRADGSLGLPTLADSAAVNSSLYFSSSTSKLTYKDSGGILHAV